MDLTEVYYLLAATGVLVAAIYYIMNLRYNMKAREMEICRLHTQDFISQQGLQKAATMITMEWKDYEDFMNKYWISNPETWTKWFSHFFVFEASGILIRNKVVKPEMLYYLGGYGAILVWEKYKDIIQRWRESEWGVHGALSNAEFFVQEMQKM